jgi:regulator of sigma E protease
MSLQSTALFIILLGVLITVHELGHFLIAKWLNVKVLRFSVGFGPKIIGFTRGETEYRIAWIPLGGYVKMAGELPHDEVSPQDASRGFLAQPPWKRALIVVGGPLFNLIFPVLVYFFVFVGNQQALSTQIRHVEPGLPAAVAGLEPGDRVLAVDGEKVATFNQLLEKLDDRAERETRLTVQRGDKTFDATLTPAKAFIADVLASDTRGRIGISPTSPSPMIGVAAGSPAEQAGLHTFDRIVSINGQPVPDLLALREVLRGATGTLEVKVARLESLDLPDVPAAAPKLVTVQIDRLPGEGLEALGAERASLYLAHVYPGGPAAEAGLKRGDRLLAVNGRPLTSFEGFQVAIGQAGKEPFTLEWRSGTEIKSSRIARGKFEHTGPLGEKVKAEGIGVSASSALAVEKPIIDKVTVHIGPAEALARSAERVPEVTLQTLRVIALLVTGDIPFNTVGGPLMMYGLASRAAQEGLDYFLNLMAVISVNLGVMNLLPIPVLDGFALLSAIWEGVRRRPIPMRVREIANMVGLAMLVILMALVMRNDLMR